MLYLIYSSHRPCKEEALPFCKWTHRKRAYLRGKILHMTSHDSEHSASQSPHSSYYIPLPDTISNLGVRQALYECMFIHNPNKMYHILPLGRFHGMVFVPLWRVIYFDTLFGKSSPISPFFVAGDPQFPNHPSFDAWINGSLESWRPHGTAGNQTYKLDPYLCCKFYCLLKIQLH